MLSRLNCDLLGVSLVKWTFKQPLITIQLASVTAIGFPSIADPVIPSLEHGLVLIKVWVSGPSLESPETLLAIKQAVMEHFLQLVATRQY